MKVTKAIVLAGGYGTRRLPLTKAIDKCMLPIGDRPIIDYVVQDCVNAGITDIYIALSQLGEQVRAYFGRNVNLERYLLDRGKTEALELAKSLPKARLHFFDDSHWPDEAQGTASPVARFTRDYQLADDEQIVVVGGDDFIYRPEGGSAVKQLIKSTEAAGLTCGLIGVEVPREKVSQFGVFEVGKDGSFISVVEKPNVEDAPSNLINVSKYIFDKEMLEHVVWTMDHVNPVHQEAQLTDALNRYVKSGKKIHIAAVKGEYLDGGTLQGWLHANNRVVGSN